MNEVKIKSVKAIDVAKLPTVNSCGRHVVLLENDSPSVDGFMFSVGENFIFVVKDVMIRNLKGPVRREISMW